MGNCDKCERPFKESTIFPGEAVTGSGGTWCYDCWYEDNEWERDTCAECGKAFDDPDADLHYTCEGPFCHKCYAEAEVCPEGTRAPGDPLLPFLASTFMQGLFNKPATDRKSIAAMMMAAHRVVDAVTVVMVNCAPETDPEDYCFRKSPDEIAREAVADTDALLAALEEKKNADDGEVPKDRN